jgi:hypothetical protein
LARGCTAVLGCAGCSARVGGAGILHLDPLS